MRDPAPLCGIFVGGASRRMGGAPKGLLPAPDTGEPLVLRLRRIATEAGLRPVLVGRAEAYAALGLPVLADDPAGVGPLGGLAALLRAAGELGAVALSCDLPHLTAATLGRIREAPVLPVPGGRWDVVAARRGPEAPWEPLCARYAPSALPILSAALAAGERSFQGLFRRLAVVPLALAPEALTELADWDEPGDIVRG